MKTRLSVGALLVAGALCVILGRTSVDPVPSPPDRPVRQTPRSSPPPSSSPHLSGRVTRDGRAVAGARVHLERAARFGALLRVIDTVTNESGQFKFEDLTSGEYLLSAREGEHRSAVVPVLLPGADGASVEQLELALLDCVLRVSGRVLDTTTNEPVPGAEVRVRSAAPEKPDEGGIFHLCIGEGAAKISATADGYGPADLVVEGAGHIRRDVFLSPQAFVIGQTVSGPSDVAVPGANLLIKSRFGDAEAFVGQSDSTGRFRIATAPGEFNVIATAPGLATALPFHVAVVGGSASAELLVRLEGVSEVSGRVTCNGVPVAGARIVAHTPSARGVTEEALSAADGSFVLSHVPLQTVTFTAEPYEVLPPQSRKISASKEVVALELRSRASISGEVRAESAPQAGAIVTATSAGFTTTVLTDGAGQYKLVGLREGEYEVRARASNVLSSAPSRMRVSEGQEAKLDLQLLKRPAVSGRVVDESENPIERATVHYLSRGGGAGVSTCSTDSEGQFTCGFERTGEYSPRVLSAEGAELQPVRSPLPSVQFTDTIAPETQLLRVTYVKSSIRGRVVEGDGSPAPGVKVTALKLSGQEEPLFHAWLRLPGATTDRGGRFSIAGLSPGRYAVNATSVDGDQALSFSETGGQDVVLTLRQHGRIEGALVGFTSVPVVYAQPLGEARQLIPGRVNGDRFQIEVPPAKYRVTAMSISDGDAATVEVREGLPAKVTLTSRGHGTVSGSVIGLNDRKPLPGFSCHIVSTSEGAPGITSWDPVASPTTNSVGVFEIDPAAAGPALVGCVGEGYSSASALLTIASGSRQEVQLVAVRRGAVESDIGAAIDPQVYPPTVTATEPGGPAAAAGLLRGDVFTAIDGVSTDALDPDGVWVLLTNRPPGSSVAVSVRRGNTPHTVQLVLRKYPE